MCNVNQTYARVSSPSLCIVHLNVRAVYIYMEKEKAWELDCEVVHQRCNSGWHSPKKGS